MERGDGDARDAPLEGLHHGVLKVAMRAEVRLAAVWIDAVDRNEVGHAVYQIPPVYKPVRLQVARQS